MAKNARIKGKKSALSQYKEKRYKADTTSCLQYMGKLIDVSETDSTNIDTLSVVA